jgi:hypothetical protein
MARVGLARPSLILPCLPRSDPDGTLQGNSEDIAVAKACSGIAATLLPVGSTAHSTFAIPLIPDQGSICFMSKNSARASLLKEARLIV